MTYARKKLTVKDDANADKEPPAIHVLAIGATGYIGSRLAQNLVTRGLKVSAIVRSPRKHEILLKGVNIIRCSLDETWPEGLLDGVQCVIHLATTANQPEPDPEFDLEVSRHIFEQVRAAQIKRLIFVSSVTAKAENPTPYGRSKKMAEELITGEGEIIVRPGFVFGGPKKGAYGSLCSLIRKLPVMPVVNAERKIYPIHIDALTDSLRALIICDQPERRIYEIGASEPLCYVDFVTKMAILREGFRPFFIKLPGGLMVKLVSAASTLGLVKRSMAERIRGLTQNLPESKTNELVIPLDHAFASRQSGVLEKNTARRGLIAEGRCLFRYLAKRDVSNQLLRRYVRALQAKQRQVALGLPRVVFWFPCLLVLFDPARKVIDVREKELQFRLKVTSYLLETSPETVHYFWAPTAKTKVRAILKLVAIGLTELSSRVFRILLFRPRI